MANTVVVLKNSEDTLANGRVRLKIKQMLGRIGAEAVDIAFCHVDAVDAAVEKNKPNLIISMGSEAFASVRAGEETLSSVRGEWLKSRFGVKLVPTYHPNIIYLEWNTQEVIEYDLIKGLRYAHTPKFPLLLGKDYRVITDIPAAQELIEYLREYGGAFSFDIETEGFDTFTDDEILCLQISTQAGEGFVLPLRGAWARHTEDTYTAEQINTGFVRFVEKDGQTTKVLSATETGRIKQIRPAFTAGSLVCRESYLHISYKKPKGHFCRGTVTNVLGGNLVTYARGGRMDGKKVPQEYISMRDIFETIMQLPNVKVAHNGKFDVHGLHWQLGIITHHFLFDTMLAYHNFHEERPHNLEFVRTKYTDVPKYDNWKKEYIKSKKHNSFAEIPNDVLWHYGAADADVEIRLVEPLWEEIEKEYGCPYPHKYDDAEEDCAWVFNNIDMPYNRALTQIENNGMLVNLDRLYELGKIYGEAIESLGKQLELVCEEGGVSPLPTWNNHNTLKPFLYEVLGFPSYLVPPSKKTKEPTTGKKAFTALKAWCNETVKYKQKLIKERVVRTPTTTPLSEKEMARRAWLKRLLELISHYKTAMQSKSLFLDGKPGAKTDEPQGMLKHIKWDGRIHCNYLQLTTSARLSASNPNLQNIANEDEYFVGAGIRTMFWAPEGYDFGEADYSSQEIRILAHLAEEENLMDVLMTCSCGINFRATEKDPERPWKFRPHVSKTGHTVYDIHQATAAKVFKVAYEDVTGQQRTFAKRITFGINYGQSVLGLSEVLGIPTTEAERLIGEYMSAFPNIRKFQRDIHNKVYKGQRISNAYGRYRHNFGIRLMKSFVSDWDFQKKASRMFRQDVNYPVQSTPADIMGNVATALTDVWGVKYEDWKAVESLSIAYELAGGQHPAIMLEEMGAKCVNLVHDSTQWYLLKENRQEALDIIQLVKERLPWEQLGWYLPVDFKLGPYWGYKEEKE